MSQQELPRKRVYEFYLKNKAGGKQFTLDHFSAENISQSTIYRIIKRVENDSGHQRKLGSGRIAKVMTKRQSRSLNACSTTKMPFPNDRRLVNSIALKSTFAEPC
jgi:hypothetical protein